MSEHEPGSISARLEAVLAQIEKSHAERSRRDKLARRLLSREEAKRVDLALVEMRETVNHCKAALRGVREPFYVMGLTAEADVLRRRLDRVSEALGDTRMTWRENNPY